MIMPSMRRPVGVKKDLHAFPFLARLPTFYALHDVARRSLSRGSLYFRLLRPFGAARENDMTILATIREHGDSRKRVRSVKYGLAN